MYNYESNIHQKNKAIDDTPGIRLLRYRTVKQRQEEDIIALPPGITVDSEYKKMQSKMLYAMQYLACNRVETHCKVTNTSNIADDKEIEDPDHNNSTVGNLIVDSVEDDKKMESVEMFQKVTGVYPKKNERKKIVERRRSARIEKKRKIKQIFSYAILKHEELNVTS